MEDGLVELVEAVDGALALAAQVVGLIKDRRNPLLFGERGERNFGLSNDLVGYRWIACTRCFSHHVIDKFGRLHPMKQIAGIQLRCLRAQHAEACRRGGTVKTLRHARDPIQVGPNS